MNKRIEQLADQCMTERQDSNGVYVEYFDHKKFAELIVRECAGVAWGIYANQEIANGIKQHFGVE